MFSYLFMFSYNRGKSVYEIRTEIHKKMLGESWIKLKRASWFYKKTYKVV